MGIDRSLVDAGLGWLLATLQAPFLRAVVTIIIFLRGWPQVVSRTIFTRFSPATIEMEVSSIRFRADIRGLAEKALQAFQRSVQIPAHIKALQLQIFILCFGSLARGH